MRADFTSAFSRRFICVVPFWAAGIGLRPFYARTHKARAGPGVSDLSPRRQGHLRLGARAGLWFLFLLGLRGGRQAKGSCRLRYAAPPIVAAVLRKGTGSPFESFRRSGHPRPPLGAANAVGLWGFL